MKLYIRDMLVSSAYFLSIINIIAFEKTKHYGLFQLYFSVPAPVEHHICPAVCVLMKLSFDEEHRHAMNELGKTKMFLNGIKEY